MQLVDATEYCNTHEGIMCTAGEYQEGGMMGEGSQGGTKPIYNSGSTQSGWSDASYNVNGSPSISAPPAQFLSLH